MELEAEILWLQSIGYDFDGKKFHQQILLFLVEIFVAEKIQKCLEIFQIPYCNSYVTRFELESRYI